MARMRIQLELPESTVTKLRQLMKEGNVRTYSEVFGYALTGLEWMAKERRQNRMIVSTDKDFTQVKELSMPILDAISPTPHGDPVSEGVPVLTP